MTTERIQYFTTKAAAINHLKSTGWQADPDAYHKNVWFKYPIPGQASRNACVGRASKIKGLWAVNYNA